MKHYSAPLLHVCIIHKHAPPPERGGEAWLLGVKERPGLRFVATHTLSAIDHHGPETAVFECDAKGYPLNYEALVGAEDGGRTMTLHEAVCLLDDDFCYGRL